MDLMPKGLQSQVGRKLAMGMVDGAVTVAVVAVVAVAAVAAVAVFVVHDLEVVPLLLIDVVRALREIRHYQKSTAMLIQLLPFSRLVRNIVRNYVPQGVEMRWSHPAMACLQTVVEEAMVLLFELTYAPNPSFHAYFSNDAAIHAKHVTIMPKDMQLMRSVIAAVTPHSALGSPKKK